MQTVKEKTVEASELIVVAQESGLDENKVQSLLSKFGESFKAAQHIAGEVKSIVVTDENQLEEMKTAREARLELKNIRVAVEHTRKELKEQSLREGKAIDGMANIIKALVIPIEEHLEKQEKFAENLAKARQQKLETERLEILLGLTDDPYMYKYDVMDSTSFDKLVASLKREKAELEAAARKAEAERIAEEKRLREEQEETRKENERLKAEAEKREAEIEAERKVEAEKQAKIDAENQLKIRQEREKAEAERQKVEALEAEKKARDELEARKKAEQEEAERKALLAPDKSKLLEFANQIDSIQLPNVQNREAGKLLDETQDFLTRISKNLRNKAKEL